MSDLNRAIDLMKRGQKPQARQIILTLLRENRQDEQAWLYLAACATSKSEFAESIQQVLRLNPANSQALEQAEKYQIPIPEEAIAAQKAAKKAAKKQKKRLPKAARGESSGGGRVRRVLLLFILLLALCGAIAFFLLNRGGEDAAETEALATQDATAESGGTGEATELSTEETTEIAIESTESAATAEVVETAGVGTENAVETTDATQEAILAPSPTRRVTNTPRPSNTPTTEANEVAVVTEEATEIPPTATTRPSATPTPIPTEIPPTATPTVPAVAPMLSLVYDEDSVYIINLTDENLDISTLRFEQENPEDASDPIDFVAVEWQNDNYRGAGSVYQLQPESCFAIGKDVPSASAKPVDCIRLTQWQARREISWFWLPLNESVTEFKVYQGEEVIATCQIDAFSCDFALLPTNE